MINPVRRFLRKIWHGPSPPPFVMEPLESERGFRISGDLDIYNVDRVRKVLEPELHGALVLDLSGVDFMDDSGLGLLVGCVKRLREREGSLVLRNLNSQIMRVFEVTGLVKVSGLRIETDTRNS